MSQFMLKFWHVKGRVNREELVFVTILLLILWGSVFLLTSNNSKVFIFSSIFIFSTYLIQTAKRYHDLNKMGINGFVWFIIPLINIIFFIELYFKKGTAGENKYGQPSTFKIKNLIKKVAYSNSIKGSSLEITADHDTNSKNEGSFDVLFDASYVLPEDKKHEQIYLLEWFANDGDWVEQGKPLFKLRVGEWIGVSTSHASQPLSAKRSGYLQIFKLKDEVIQRGDKICSVHSKGLYDRENTPANKSFKFHFDYGKYNLVDHKNSLVIKTWHKADGDIVKKGEAVLTLAYKEESFKEKYFVHYAEKDGYFDKARNLSDTVSAIYTLNQNELVYLIHEDDEDRVKAKFINVPDISIDEFTHTKIIKWKRVGVGNTAGVVSKAIGGSISLTFSFNNIGGYDYIIFQFESKEMMLAKDDRISFLFDDNSILDFVLGSNSYRSSNNHGTKLFENKTMITGQQLDHFELKQFVKWKITSKKQNQELIGGEEGIQLYKSHNNLRIVIRKLVKEYRELVRQKIADYKPLEQESLASLTESIYDEECYVYLMIDTTNSHHKIGISNKPEWREKTLQSEKPTIELLASKKFINRKIAASFEKALHETYSNKRIRGEWFLLNVKEIKEIELTLNN